MDLQTPASPLSPRAIVFGLLTGVCICAAVPFNDWALANTPLVGNNLPLAVMIVMLLFAVCVNGPLHRRRSRFAWSGGELSVAFTLMLVMCAVPSTGLMRYLQSNLAVPFALGVDSAAYRKVFDQLSVRSWVYPSFSGATPKDWVGDPLATSFAQRWLDTTRSPYGAWVRPFIAWGVFCGAAAWALLCMASIVLRQWRENEFLPFPLTNIQLALIDAPEPGRWFNRVLGRRSFWIAFFAVLTLHLWNGLHAYFPKQVVEISHGYDLTEVLKEAPWSYTDTGLRKATIYFSMIGIAYFLSSPVAVSLWFFVVWMQLWKMFLGSTGADTALPGINDQRHGVGVAIFLALLWLGRKHWRLVIAQGVRGERAGESRGTYLSYRSSFWGVIVGCTIMAAWLVAAGTTVIGAIDIVLVLMICFVLITRLIAETGMTHGAMPLSVQRPIDLAFVYGGAKVPMDTYFLAATVQATSYDYRETIPVFATHGMNAVDSTTDAAQRTRRFGRSLIAWMCVALVLAYVTSFWSAIWVQYHHSVTLDLTATSPMDIWGEYQNPRWQIMDPAAQYNEKNFTAPYSRIGNVAWGFGVTAALMVARWSFAWWPLHPVGYLIYGTFPSVTFWFSTFVGWLAKRVILHLGSARLYERCKPFFIGLILGEIGAAGVWAAVSIVLHATGVPYRSVLVLPT